MSGTDGYRYPGPNEFEDTPADHLLFSGRDDEINAITQQILSSRHLVLYGSSGLGKSSLLKAGVYPKLRENNFCPIRVRITDKMGVLQLLAESCEETGREADLDYTPGVGSTPWEFFKTAMFWRGETLLHPVLVFDQFEELFTTVRAEWKRDFTNEIGPLASGNLPDSVRRRLEQGEKGLTDLPPQVKLIFSLREEFYGSLEELSTDFPALFQDRFRLLPMSRSHAELAIRQPALKQSQGGIAFNTPPFTYANETIQVMLGFLAGRHETIEPFQLQLLCQHIERVIVPGKLRAGLQPSIEITPADLGGERVMSDLVRRFYTDSLAQLPVLQGRRARELCDTGLLSSDGHRLMLERNEILRTYRISEDTLRHLIDKRILREEPRLDSLFYEIGHDTIAHSILKTRRLRLPRKYRVPAAVVASLLVIFTAYVIATNFKLRSERNQANAAQSKAEDARAKAEKLASYLIGEDLMEAIKPLGRLEVLESVQKQIDEYLASLKSNQTGKTSDLAIQIEGLSHMNRGDLDYMQEELTQAGNEYQQARNSFEQLVQRNPRNPEWLHNLGDAEAKHANVVSDQCYLQRSLDLYQQALGHIQKALAQNTSGMDDKLHDKLLRDEADTYQNIGEALYGQRRFQQALEALKASVDLARKQPQTMQWTYILEDGLIGQGLVFDSQGQGKFAEEALQTALEAARNAARMNPFDPEAQRKLGLAENRLANFNIYRRDPEQILAQYKSLNSIMQEAVNWEPKNERWQRDFAYTFLLLGEAHSYAKRTDVAGKLLQQAIPRFERIRQIDSSNASLISDLADSHRDWGNFVVDSDPATAVEHYKEALKRYTDLRKIDSTNNAAVFSSAYTLFNLGGAQLRNSKPDEALDSCRQGLQLLKAVEPIDTTDTEYSELSSLLHWELGDALHAKNDDKGAAFEYQASLNSINQAIQQAPTSPRYLNDRFLLRFDHMTRAEEDSDRRLKLDQAALADARRAAELDPDTAVYYYNQAVVQSRVGSDFEARKQSGSALQNYTEAEQAYKKAIALAGKQDAHDYRYQLRLLLEESIAPLHAQMNDKQGTQQAYEEDIRIQKDEIAADPAAVKYLGGLSGTQTAAGDKLASLGDSTTALRYYEDSEQTLRKGIETSDKTSAESYRTALYDLLYKHVAPLRMKHDKQGALDAYEQAIKVRQDEVASEPSNAGYRANLASAYEEIGNQLRDNGQLTEAADSYKHALETRREAIKLEPTATEWDALGGIYYNGLASLRDKQGDSAAVVDSYRQAADTEKQAVALDPKNATYVSNVGYAYQAIGNTLFQQHDKTGAEHEYDQSAEWFQKSILLDSKNPASWYGLTLTCEKMAQIHQDTRDVTVAKRYYDQAREAANKAAELDPKRREYIDERASIENKIRQLAPH